MKTPVLVSRDHLEDIAWRNPGAVIEFSRDTAFVHLEDGPTFMALLRPTERAA